MEEEILLSETEEIQETDEVTEMPVTKILKKRCGNKLLLANKGCCSIIGFVEKIGSTFFVGGYIDPFTTESQAVDFLLYGII